MRFVGGGVLQPLLLFNSNALDFHSGSIDHGQILYPKEDQVEVDMNHLATGRFDE